MEFFFTLLVTIFFTISVLAQQNKTGPDDTQEVHRGSLRTVTFKPSAAYKYIVKLQYCGKKPCDSSNLDGKVLKTGLFENAPSDVDIIVRIPRDAKKGIARIIGIAYTHDEGKPDQAATSDTIDFKIVDDNSKIVRSPELTY